MWGTTLDSEEALAGKKFQGKQMLKTVLSFMGVHPGPLARL